MTDSQIIALFLGLLPIVALVIAYSVYVFRHGNVNDEDRSSERLRGQVKGVQEELVAVREELANLRDTISALDRESVRNGQRQPTGDRSGE